MVLICGTNAFYQAGAVNTFVQAELVDRELPWLVRAGGGDALAALGLRRSSLKALNLSVTQVWRLHQGFEWWLP